MRFDLLSGLGMEPFFRSLDNPLTIGWTSLDPGWLVWLALAVSATAAGHAMLHKRHPQAAMGWVAVVWLLPFYGPLLYGLLGVNRVRQRARSLDYDWRPAEAPVTAAPASRQRLADTAGTITGMPLCGGNAITALVGGEAAFEAMLASIETAEERVWLSTYIFEADSAGLQFVDALSRARQRGVQVRVVVDGVGALYSRPHIARLLRRRGIPVALFLPPRFIPLSIHVNLRNHRKLLIVDQQTVFTGGMNLTDRHCLTLAGNDRPTQDIHFRVIGPVAAHFARLFAHDWQFASGQSLTVTPPAAGTVAPAWCRAVVDGPDENLDRLRALIQAAVTNASQRVRIMTPYFLPTPDLIAALLLAVNAGVAVDVVLPRRGNLPPVDWAMGAVVPRLAMRGIRFWHQPGPFAHSKLLLIDRDYALVGSANLDARSLRLNFEVGLEIYDAGLAGELNDHFETVIARSALLTAESLTTRGLHLRLRDAAAWLFSPYL